MATLHRRHCEKDNRRRELALSSAQRDTSIAQRTQQPITHSLIMAKQEPIHGPAGHENWRAALRGERPQYAFEVQLYSDAYITGQVRGSAERPYSFLNAVPAGAIGTFAHVITLRVSVHTALQTPDLSRTDDSRYHGGWLADEISSLAGLLLGIRLRPGGISRDFRSNDPMGQPRADTSVPESPLPRIQSAWIVPRAHETHNLNENLDPLLDAYPKLSASQAVSLVRAARLYQDAIWVSESEPELAWLLLVSAVEVVATHEQVQTHKPEDMLQLALPALHATLESAGGAALVAECAAHVSGLTKATARFIGFLLEFLPSEPSRPDGNVELIPWNKAAIRKAIAKVYEYRSRALHDGTPFPWPMCRPPMFCGTYYERPHGSATGFNEATWLARDMPMLLHVFEHIARGAIIQWWASKAASKDAPVDPPNPGMDTADSGSG
ncbi:hypothetical protein [Sorangium sp. So ce1182]|uniref:hypothetical protein n=1 Tax=Sorangium sp. So ce1182 TaxID=3133334 RepID=UPI003F5FC7DC